MVRTVCDNTSFYCAHNTYVKLWKAQGFVAAMCIWYFVYEGLEFALSVHCAKGFFFSFAFWELCIDHAQSVGYINFKQIIQTGVVTERQQTLNVKHF